MRVEHIVGAFCLVGEDLDADGPLLLSMSCRAAPALFCLGSACVTLVLLHHYCHSPGSTTRTYIWSYAFCPHVPVHLKATVSPAQLLTATRNFVRLEIWGVQFTHYNRPSIEGDEELLLHELLHTAQGVPQVAE